MLNLTDISYGTYGYVCQAVQSFYQSLTDDFFSAASNNKYYLGQLIFDRGNYIVFRKWGRVGVASPQSQANFYATAELAERAFQKVFRSKSGNNWPVMQPFVRKKGKYYLVELDDNEASVPSANTKLEEKYVVTSKLPQEVQNIVKLICDPEVVTREMVSLNVDLKRFPLGKLSKAQITQGYEILQRLSAALEDIEQLSTAKATPKTTKARAKSRRKAKAKAKGPTAATSRSLSSLRASLNTLSSEFYSLIPHDFGRSLPPVIDSMDDLKSKLELLEVLSNLEISQMLQKQEAEKPSEPAIHPFDIHYKMLNTHMEPLSDSQKEYKIIQKYGKCLVFENLGNLTIFVDRFIQNTGNGSQFTIDSVLKISRPDEDSHKEILESLDNHMLLWHGSRLSNFVGILSQGLRIAPPEAPKNGYQFGKGLYFADALAKSANYCCATSKAILLLADVALGKSYKTPNGEFLDYTMVKTQRGCDSTHGLGRMAPAENEFETLPDGVLVPAGTLKPVSGNQHLLYNEFIVYRREQVQLRYLVALNLSNVACASQRTRVHWGFASFMCERLRFDHFFVSDFLHDYHRISQLLLQYRDVS
ncbi:putative Poly [ADP-ribose] polymerase, poly(ADP-ribose) polymerase, regulatory domain superfamily [Plasmopara halstedii]